MRHLMLCLLFLSSSANAQFIYDYPIVCDDSKAVIKSLGSDFQEKLTWKGKHDNDESVYSLWTNEREKSWTLLKMTPQFSCILGVGEESKLIWTNPA